MKRCVLPLLMLLILWFCPPRDAKALSYTITDLGTLGSSTIFTDESIARDINNVGQVVGEATEITSLQKHAFLWDSTNGMQDLGTLGGSQSIAHRINDLGQIVGESRLGTLGQLNIRAFLWDSINGMQNLGSFGGHSFAYGLNNSGQVVGASQETPGGNFSHAFLWDSVNGMQNLNDLLPANSDWNLQEARDINESGQIVGWGLLEINTVIQTRAFLWDPIDGIRSLSTLGGSFSHAVRINNLGQVMGYSTNGAGISHAFLWDSISGMQDLGLGPSSNDMNDPGQIVGRYSIQGDPHRGALYSNGTATKLNDLVGIPDNGSSWILEEAYGINDVGQIVGWGSHPQDGGGNHAFLMTPEGSAPIPEPSTLLLFGIGTLGIIGLSYRRKPAA